MLGRESRLYKSSRDRRNHMMIPVTDWIVAICTVVYVLATLVIMYANRKSADLSQKQLREEKKQFEKQQRLAVRPYLNLYVAKEDEVIGGNEHHHITLDKNSGRYFRTFSIRNIGNGTAKDIEIYIKKKGDLNWQRNIAGRNCFMLVNKQYIYDIHYNKFENMLLSCRFTDLYDNTYHQEMELYWDSESRDILSHTHKPEKQEEK